MFGMLFILYNDCVFLLRTLFVLLHTQSHQDKVPDVDLQIINSLRFFVINTQVSLVKLLRGFEFCPEYLHFYVYIYRNKH